MSQLYTTSRARRRPRAQESLSTLLHHASKPAQVFTIDPVAPEPLVCHPHLRIHIPEGAMRTLSGKISQQPVKVAIKLLHDPREALLAGWSIQAGTRPLHHYGAFSWQLSSQNQPIHLLHPATAFLPASETVTQPQWFQARTADIQSQDHGTMKTWSRLTSDIPGSKRIQGQRHMAFSLPKNGIFAWGIPYTARQSNVMLSVRAFGSFNHLDESLAYLIFDREHAVIQMHHGRRCSFSGFNLPANQPAWLLVLGYRNGQCYLGQKRLSPLHNRIESIELSTVSAPLMIEAIRSILC